MSISSLSDASTLLVRNIESFRNQRCLLVNGPGDHLAAELKRINAEVYSLNHHYGYHLNYQSQSEISDSCFAPLPCSEWQQFDAIIVYWPKEKPLARLLLEQLSHFLTSDGALYCVGANKGGIKSSASVCKQLGLHCNKLDAARHCSLFTALVPEGFELPAIGLQAYQSQVDIECAQQHFSLAALPGVFSSGRLDEGTQLLLENMPKRLGQRILDFGCGCGVITTSLALADSKRQLTGVDVNACALYASAQTFAANQISAQVQPVAGSQDLQGQKFDAIVTNPPFHQGVSTHYQVTEQLIAQSPSLLNKGGQLILVANRHLNYPPLLEKAYGQVIQLAKTNKFVVYQCIKR